MLQVSEPSMIDPEIVRRSPAAEVAFLQEGYRKAPERGVPCYEQPEHAASDHDDVVRVFSQ